ncbi:MAG: AsmA family protein [Bosea sp.]|uniref:AsmA family protein n=1 Tax=Bosea sp. (in: a-proteobacteria) TaxID=1871050 RepID=UPI001AC19C84|nr:AsmA family protein [Bosea sp. (in: a-proteobacteria)]MBN9469645.1 AsmA family protein [Bosea sp. (in: a-proteobacteria)]
MREALTFLAGLLVAALLAALLGPGFVDWREYRGHFEQRIGAALGLETRIAGDIGLRLLPSPRLTLRAVKLGAADGESSAATIERLTVELALAALARGDFRLTEAEADGMALTLIGDADGAVSMPPRHGTGLPAATAIDRFAIRRSAIIWREAGKPAKVLAPISVDLAAAGLGGPWRIEGEVAGASLRFATGEAEADGRLRAKIFVTGEQNQLSFDGALSLPMAGGRLQPSLQGAFTLTPGGALSLSGTVGGGARQLDFSSLAIEIAGGAARLEGEGHVLPATGSGGFQLRARRLDADALIEALDQRPGFERALQALPGALDLSLDLDQIAWRGEDLSGFSLRGRLDQSGVSGARAGLRIANATLQASGDLGEAGFRGELSLKAPDARRAALALARLGVEPALADGFAAFREFEGAATLDWRSGQLGVERLSVKTGSGQRLEGSAAVTPGKLEAKLRLDGLDLANLPPGESLTGLAGGRDLALDLTLGGVRYRATAPGSARLALTRQGSDWRLSRLSVEGFGGVRVEGQGALLPDGGEISGRVRAPRFAALAALAGALLPDQARRILPRIEDGLAGLDSSFRLTRASSGETGLVAEGTAQAGKLSLNAGLGRTGDWTGGELRLALDDRRRAFAAFGLPRPAQGGPGELRLDFGAGGPAGSLSGPGLAMVLEGAGEGVRLNLQAEAPGLLMPEGLARLLPQGVIDASGKIRFGEESMLEDLVVNSGGRTARGALALGADGAIGGKLALPAFALQPLLTATLGSASPVPGSVWSPARFQAAPGLGEIRLAITTERLAVSEQFALDKAAFQLATGIDGLSISDLSGRHAGGEVSGGLSIRREGGLAQLSGRLGLAGLDLATLTGGALTGKLSGRFEAGGSGESPARLIAGLGGAGSISVSGAGMSRFDPAALSRVIAATGEDASESETERLQDRIATALEQANWPLGDVTVPFTQAGGVLRVQPVTFERAGLRAEASGTVDWRAMNLDLRLALRPLSAPPKDWPQQLPQVGFAWRGPIAAPRREADVAALSNVVAARALAKEIERVEAFEADQRERAFFSRRLRAEREMRENERKLAEFLKAEEERRLAEEKRAEEARKLEEARLAEDARKAELARRAEEARQAEEARRAEIARRLEEARLAEEARKLELTKRQEEARKAEEERRRVEAEERARQAAIRAAIEGRSGPMILQGAPPSYIPGDPYVRPRGEAPPLAPPLDIQPVPRPLSRSPN